MLKGVSMDPDLWSAFMDNLVSRLFSLAQEKLELYTGFEADVTFLMRELPMITSAIDRQFLGQDDHILSLSVQELRQIARDIEDCIDQIIMYNASREQQSWLSYPWKKRKSYTQLGAEMQRLRHRLEEAVQRRNRYSEFHPSTSSQQLANSTLDHVHRDDLVGIDAPLEELRCQLVETEGQLKQLKIITIVGFCGLGKTVLALELYNSEAGKGFKERAWVSAGNGDPRKLLTEILKKLHKPPLETSDIDQLRTDLSNFLNNKRYFIVIDDMQSDQWSVIKSAFPRGDSSRIVVTTKIQKVANICSSTNGYIYKMKRLNDKHSKQLFLKKACPVEYSDYLGPDLAAILKKCDGQPLALTTVGQFMGNNSWPTGGDCEDMCRQVRFYHLVDSGDETLKRMHQMLIHDYTRLPSYSLKDCFLYFAMFPSDHPVRTKRLMRIWLAEGLVHPSNSGSDPAFEKFKKLMDQNIIEPIDVSYNTNVKTCKTYGMMHEYITLKSRSENLIALCDDGRLEPNHARRISLHDSSITDASNHLEFNLTLVRSLIVMGKAGNAMLDFSKYQLLRVLDLQQCTDLGNDHLKEVCNLLLLKYLSLGSTITSLPGEIIRLQFLETLDLRRTAVKILRPEVIKLPNLTHLFGKFKLQNKAVQNELLKFIGSGKCKLQTLAGFLVDESEGFAEVMIHMKKLRKVKIWCESTATNTSLTTLHKAIQEFIRDEKDACNDPRSLSVSFEGCSEDFLKDLKAPCYLRSLKIQGRLLELPGFVTELRRLRELCLQLTKMEANLLAALTNLKHLQYLQLVADELDEIIIKDKALPRLLCLCFVLQRPTFPKIEEGALPFLESLQLLCKDMDGLSGIQIKGFRRLREVMLDGRATDATKMNWMTAAKEHPNRPKVLLKRAIPPKLGPGGDSTAYGATENEIVDCFVLLQGQVQETGTRMPHDEPNSAFLFGTSSGCGALTGSSISDNGAVAS